jgi:hypothetical protein
MPKIANLPLPIEAIVFVKLTDPDSALREIPISQRRASMLLYESAHWIATGGFLLGGQLKPALPSFNYRSLRTIASIVSQLSLAPLYLIEGGADSVGAWLADRFGDGSGGQLVENEEIVKASP